jgi:deoxyribonuclease IV
MLFGPASIGSPALEGLKHLASLGIKTSEVAFGRGVYMRDNVLAKEVGKLSKSLGISLSVHAPYFVNLATDDPVKKKASIARVLSACERGFHMGAKEIIFHPAYYMEKTHEEVYALVKDAMISMQKTIKKNKWGVILCPETTGKGSQFGSLDELTKLSKEIGCGVCVDFAHLKARDIGVIDYDVVMKKVKKIKHLTCHFSGIVWGQKGELHHELTKEKDIKELLSYLIKYKIDTRIINESPDVVGDTIKTMKIWEKLKKEN